MTRRFLQLTIVAGLVPTLGCRVDGGGGEVEWESTTGGSSTGTGEDSSEADGSSEASGASTETGSGEASDTSGPKFDIGTSSGTDGGCPQTCGGGSSYVWIANAGDHTVSKIDTRTLVEEGRYRTRPDGAGDPSRTSVSIDGKAVVVANRAGGLVKIWASAALCEEQNGVPGIQTSSGGNDVLAWGEEECVAWYTPFVDMSTQRPVGWTPGTWNPETCEREDQKIWTVTGKNAAPGYCGPGGVWVHRLDGDTGMVEDVITIPDSELLCQTPPIEAARGPYGGVVDGDGNLWFHVHNNPTLARIDAETLTYQLIPMPQSPYGIGTDSEGRIWLNTRWAPPTRTYRFDPDAYSWDFAPIGSRGGIAQDHEGRMWTANADIGIASIDPETMAIGDVVALPDSGVVKGLSVDVDGYLWVTRAGLGKAFKVDPQSLAIEELVGLDKPYTYSDMTGGSLTNVACPPEG